MDKPEGVLNTSIGQVRFTMTESTHVYLYTDHEVTIRGVKYYVSNHLYLRDGKWQIETNHWHRLGRVDHKETSTSARIKSDEVLLQAWVEYITEHPELNRQADIWREEDMIGRIINDLDELHQRVEEKEKDLQERQQHLADLMVG